MFIYIGLTIIGVGLLGYYYRYQILKSDVFVKLLTLFLINDKISQFVEGYGNFAMISYKRRGRDYLVYLPYNKRKISQMSGKRVILEKQGKKIDVTQQPGLSYLLTASQMGGSGFSIIDESGEFHLDEHTIPFN